MSDYISKEETINTIWKTFDSFADNPSNFELEETYAIRKFCFKLQEEMKAQPILDEKEIIRKPFERVIKQLNGLMPIRFNGFGKTLITIEDVIKILKEECGSNE